MGCARQTFQQVGSGYDAGGTAGFLEFGADESGRRWTFVGALSGLHTKHSIQATADDFGWAAQGDSPLNYYGRNLAQSAVCRKENKVRRAGQTDAGRKRVGFHM